MVSIAILRTGPDVAEPVPVSMACELSSYGFFQRQVRQALPQTNARKLIKPWFSGLLAFFCCSRREECCVYGPSEGVCWLNIEDVMCAS